MYFSPLELMFRVANCLVAEIVVRVKYSHPLWIVLLLQDNLSAQRSARIFNPGSCSAPATCVSTLRPIWLKHDMHLPRPGREAAERAQRSVTCAGVLDPWLRQRLFRQV